MRAAGCDHVELKRFSMCRRTCEPIPSTTRPPEYSCSWFVVYARLIGLRAKAMATPVPSDTEVECSAASVSDRKGSFVVSAAHRQSSPAASAARTRSATLGSSAPRPLSIFTAPRRTAAVFTRRRTGAGVGAGPFTAGASTESDSGIPTWTKRPAAGWR